MSSTTAASFNPSSSSSSSPASTTSASNNSSSDAATAVTVYRDCVRGVKRVEGIKRQQLAAGVDVGVVSGAGLSLLLSPRHIEFALVIDARCLPSSTSSTSTASSAEPKWLGFSYFGYLENLKRCFRKTHDDLLSYAKIIHENLTTQFSDPYASPLLFVGDSYEKAFWQISSPEAPHSVVGFIPFRPVSLFHSLKSHPIIAMEGGNYPIFTMISGIDRHRLRAVSPELEARYQQTVQTATTLVSPHKLSHLQVHSVLSSKRPPANAANGKKKAGGSHDDSPKYSGEVVRKLVDDFYKHYASKSEDKKGLQPILVSGLVLASGSVTREVELVTLSMASMGKTHLMQAAQLLAPPTPTTGGSKALKDNLPDADRLAKELDHYQKRLEQLKLLLAQEPRIAIYNPFLSAANTVVLPTPAPTSSDASPVHQSPPQHAHQPPQQQFDMSTQTMASNQGASLLTASLQQRQPPAASTRHSSSQYRGGDDPSIDFPSPAIDDASNGNGGRQPSPVPSLRAPSSYLPALSSSTATLATPTSASTSPSAPLHSSGGSGISNAGSGSMTPSHRLAGSSSSRPTTPSSANGGTPRPFLRLSASQPAQDFTHGQDMSVLYRRLIELLYVSHPIPGGSYAPVLSSPFAHQHAAPSLRTSTTPPTSMGSSSTSLPVRRFFAPTAPANTPLSLSRSSSGFIRRSASPSTITFLSSAAPGFPAPSTSSSWKRFPRVTSSPAIAFPTPGGSGPVDYADFITPEQLLATSGSAHAPSFGRQGDVTLRSSASPPVHRQPSPASPPAQPVLEPFQHPQHPHQPHAYPPQAYHHHQPQPAQRSSPVPIVPVAVQPSPAAPAQPLPEHHPHAPSNAAPVPAPARALRLSQSQAPHHPRMPEAHFAHPQQPAPSLRVSTGGLAPPAAEVHPNESASDFLLRLIGGNKDAAQHDEDHHQSAQEGANGLPEPAHIDRGILAYSVAAALAKHQQQHQQQHGGIHAH